ncbi:adaptor protein MecA [Heyndrickxia sp. NPDC080065]|uniref:adaptor protein MecA n=1 Tax=Heyndrickxia sp. NPDC080065 TaxID=3390568 RepID=UPI003D0397B7
MKLERLARNKIKYSISFEELSAKGFLEGEIESFIWYDLFDEMVEIAQEEYHCEIPDTISIEIFSLNSKEIVLILTMDEISQQEEIIQNQLIHSHIKESIYCFESIENVIALANRLNNLSISTNSKLIVFEDQYFLVLPTKQPINVLCEEFGDVSSLSVYMLEEYGNIIIEQNALGILTGYFNRLIE